MLATALVALFTVSELTVMPEPKLAVLVPLIQLVKTPVRFTFSLTSPCVPVGGLTALRWLERPDGNCEAAEDCGYFPTGGEYDVIGAERTC